MPWIPEYPGEIPTLGWNYLDFCAEHLAAPERIDYVPFEPTREQAQFALNYYRIDVMCERRKIRRGVYSRPKGSGKSPFLGSLAIFEGLGDAVFDGWDADGRPVGKPWRTVLTPLCQILATEESQTQNAYAPLLDMLVNGPACDHFPGLEPMQSFVALPYSGKIEWSTSASTSKEGGKPIFAVFDQALALDTPIPTPAGWTTMGELQAGDTVYGSTGAVQVSEAKPVSLDHDCYEVTFADGTSVVASAGHLWWSKRSGDSYYGPKVRTTVELLNGKFRIPVAPTQERDDADLPIHPYLLGLWLGDGTRGKCEITVSEGDLEHVQEKLSAIGVPTHARRYEPNGRGYGTEAAVNLSFSSASGYQSQNRPAAAQAMSKLACYRDKHVPIEYIQSSIAQRTQLLRGLMDSDGCCTKTGCCTFVSTDKALADSVVELLRSLGQVTSGAKWVDDPRYTEGGRYRVDFTPRGGFQPFSLPRKKFRVRQQHSRGPEWVTIKSIVQVPRVAVRCIAVDSDDHLFAAGRGGHLTHNTESWLPNNGGVNLARVVRRNLGKRSGSSIEAPNAYRPGLSSVAEASAQYWAKIQEGKAREDGLLYDHREWPAETDMSDRESLLRGLCFVYGESGACCGGWVDIERIAAEIWDPDTDPQEARQYYGNQVTHASDSWVSQPQMAAIARPLEIVADGEMIVMGFDGSRHRTDDVADSTALIGCRVSDGLLFPIGVWEQPEDEKEWWAPVLEIDATVKDAFKRFNVVGFYADPAADWRSLVNNWEALYVEKLKVKSTSNHPIEWWMGGQNLTKTTQAIKQLHSAIMHKEAYFDGSSVLIRHFLNARRRENRVGYSISKAYPTSRNKIDAAVAAVLAWQCRLDVIAHGIPQQETTRRSKTIRRW